MVVVVVSLIGAIQAVQHRRRMGLVVSVVGQMDFGVAIVRKYMVVVVVVVMAVSRVRVRVVVVRMEVSGRCVSRVQVAVSQRRMGGAITTRSEF